MPGIRVAHAAISHRATERWVFSKAQPVVKSSVTHTRSIYVFRVLTTYVYRICGMLICYTGSNTPIWLNADVLQGPAGQSASIPANRFIETCLQHTPNAVLSLGWTTGNVPDCAVVACDRGGFVRLDHADFLIVHSGCCA